MNATATRPAKRTGLAWNPDELATMRAHYSTMPKPELLALLPRRKWANILEKGSQLAIPRTTGAWDAANDALLRQHYPTKGAPGLSKMLDGLSRNIIHKRAKQLGVRRSFTGPLSGVARLYSEAEKQVIRSLYPRAPRAELLAALPGRPYKSICKVAKKLGLARCAAHWRPEHEQLLRETYPIHGADYVARATGKTRQQVIAKACNMKVKSAQPQGGRPAKANRVKREVSIRHAGRPSDWQVADQERLIQLYPTSTPSQLLAAFPGRTMLAIRGRAGRMGLQKTINPIINWTAEQNAILVARYELEGPEPLARKLGRSVQAVKQRANRLGLTVRQLTRLRPASPVPTTEHDPRPKASNTLKPLQTSRARVEPVKRSPATPLLNARMEQRRHREVSTPLTEILADMKRPNCPPARRLAFTVAAHQGMPAAIKAWDEWPTTQQKAA